LTGWYDRTIAATTREGTWRPRLLSLMELGDRESVLDIGCGTGTLSLAIHGAAPSARVAGIDADEQALAIARRKAEGTPPGLSFHQGLAQHLPFRDHEFDLAVSSLFFHHLPSEGKRAVLKEARRVLRPDGRLAVADWGRPTGRFSRAAFLAVQLLDGFETTRDSVSGALPRMIEEAGFEDLREHELLRTPVGVMRFWCARFRA
jgi:ubiquinone/menaquinone biosynthesis C-methylase UbiE